MSNQAYEQLLQSHLAGQNIGVPGLTAHDHQRNLAALLPFLAARAGGHVALWIGPQTLHAVNTALLQQQTGLSVQVREGTSGWMIIEARGQAGAPMQTSPSAAAPGKNVSISQLPGTPQPVAAMSTVSGGASAAGGGLTTRLEALRWRWIPVGALVMGAVAVGASYLLFNTSALDSMGGPTTQLRVMFGLACFGYLFGGFVIALASPGKTIAEPLIAALLAYATQLTFIEMQFEAITSDFLGIPTILLVAIANGLFAYGGSWLGETITHKN